MSRIGKTPVKLPDGVKFDLKDDVITITGPKGSLDCKLQPGIEVKLEDNVLFFDRADDSRQQKAFHGLVRALVNNMVIGVTQGYEKVLHVIGTGYTAEVVGPWLKLNVGYSHEILMEIPDGINVDAKTIPRREQGPLGIQAVITVTGIDKEDVGKFSAEIRECRKPAPNLKGKGIRWAGEHVKIVAKAGA